MNCLRRVRPVALCNVICKQETIIPSTRIAVDYRYMPIYRQNRRTFRHAAFRHNDETTATALRSLKPKSQRNEPQYFVDMKQVKVMGGSGGDGMISFLRLWINDHAGPDGGDGGHGGHVIFQIGLPNAGKSTLLRAISRARPKVASYPFTTLKPHLGMVLFDDYEQIAVADLPGLIEDSHKNRGLGITFLKHAERCAALLFIIDVSLDEPWLQLETLQYEINQFSKKLGQRPMLVIANKMDLPRAEENLKMLREKVSLPIVPISAKIGMNITTLLYEMRRLYDRELKEKNSGNIKDIS